MICNPSSIIYGQNNQASGAGVSSVNDGTYTRLAVSTAPTGGVAISQPAIGSGPAAKTIQGWLSTGGGGTAGSQNLLVNGSGTAGGTNPPQTFYFTPKVATLSVYYIRLMMAAASFAPSGASFGGAGSGGLLGSNNPAALTRGLVVSCISNSVTTTLYTLYINEDFLALNGNARIVDMGSGMMFIGDIFINQPLVLNTTDQVAVTVNDNLTGRNLTSFRACFCGVRP